MKHVYRITVPVLAMAVFFSTNATCEEEKVLQTLNAIKTHVETGVSPETLAGLLDEAKVQIDILDQDNTANDCFREAVTNCYYWYNLARRSRETMTRNQIQRDKYDQEAIFGDEAMRPTYEKMVANYEKLIRHAYEAEPSKWNYGNAALQIAHECIEAKED
jgi:hypothetical protein